jgi:polygalacturonase
MRHPEFIALALTLLLSSPGAARYDPGQSCAEPPSSPRIINVKEKRAKGNGKADDTEAIQNAIDAIAGTGGTVLVPNGIYLVDAVGPDRLKLKSDMTLRLEPRAILKANPNKAPNYSLLDISGISNVTVTGGTLEGERRKHRGKKGEGGMGIRILRGARNITISGVTAKEMWGDGFYVKGATNVRFCAVSAVHNRRQGLSIVDADGVMIANSSFSQTRGTPPSAGIDLEPNDKQRVSNVRILDSEFSDNAGAGIKLHGKRSTISNLEIQGNVFKGNRPIVLKGDYAALASNICGNRYIAFDEHRPDGPYAYGEPVRMVHHDASWIVTLNGGGGCARGAR